jgi:hypothetical protein
MPLTPSPEEEATRQAQNIVDTFRKDHPDKKSVSPPFSSSSSSHYYLVSY